jgi:hypothetical protein
MRQFHAAIVEFRRGFDGAIATHPYESGWADEAVFFVELEELSVGSTVRLAVQLSPDGLRWVDEGTVLELDQPDHVMARLTNFGGFLRLAGEVTGTAHRCTMTVRLALKG